MYTLLENLDDLREKEEPIKRSHKEENYTQIVSDERENFRNFLKIYIHPLDVDSHQDKTSLCTIYTGQHGSKHMKEFEAALPEGFHNTFQKTVVTMKENMTMNRSKLRTKFLKTRNEESKRRFNLQRNSCVRLLRKTKRYFFGKLDHRVVSDNRKFWKTVGPLFSEKDFFE